MKQNKFLLLLTTLGLAVSTSITPLFCETITKTVDLQKNYSYCTFKVEGSDIDDTSAYLTSPSDVKYSLSYVDKILVATIESVEKGTWTLNLDSETDDLSDVKMYIDANTLVSKETNVTDTSVVSKITNLKSYLEDRTIHLSWTNDTDESVLISLSNADDSTLIVDRENCKGSSWEYTIDENVTNVLLTIVPYSYSNFDNAKTTILLSTNDLPKAEISLSVQDRTSEEITKYEIATEDTFSVYNNGDKCSGDTIKLTEGSNLIVFKVTNDKGFISTYEFNIVKDTKPPVISLSQDINNASTEYENVTISGNVQDAVSLYVQGNKVTFNDEGDFETNLTFDLGANEVVIKAIDDTGNTTEYVAYVTRLEPKSNRLLKALLLIGIPSVALIIAFVFIFLKVRKLNKAKVSEKEDELTEVKKELDNEKYNATHDELTKCKNRKGYVKDLKNFDMSDICIIAFDVNNLKWTNDNLGHEKGDKLLTTIAGVLRDKYENVYRMGGDEFNVLCKASEFDEMLLMEVDEILKIYTEEDTQSIVYQVAHGYAFGDGKLSATEIWKQADSKMYVDKKEKKAVGGNKEEEPKGKVSTTDIDKALDRAKTKLFSESLKKSKANSFVAVKEIKTKKFNPLKLLSIIPYVVLLLLLYLVLHYIIFIGKVESSSMSPTYEIGDVVIGSKVYYVFNNIERGDTVFAKQDGKVIGKRIVGIAGDTITFENGYLCINGIAYIEDYLSDENITFGVGSYQVPENSVFLLGDNRNNSLDSRYYDNPYISAQDIVGKSLLVIPAKYVLTITLSLSIILLLVIIFLIIQEKKLDA